MVVPPGPPDPTHSTPGGDCTDRPESSHPIRIRTAQHRLAIRVLDFNSSWHFIGNETHVPAIGISQAIARGWKTSGDPQVRPRRSKGAKSLAGQLLQPSAATVALRSAVD